MEAKSLNVLLRLKRSPFAFPLAALAAIAMIVISEVAYWQSMRSMRELGTIGEARLQLTNLSRRVVDAESGQRGYLLTGRTEYLQPYRGAFTDIDAALKWLRAYYAGNPAHAQSLAKLEALVQRKLSELDATMGLYDEGKTEAWRTVLSRMKVSPTWLFFVSTVLLTTNCAYSQAALARLVGVLLNRVHEPASW